MQETNDSTKTTKQILDKFLPNVLAFAKADTSTYYYGDNIILDDSIFRQLIVGKFIDKKTIIAVEINIKDTLINFYSLENETWKLIGSEKTNIDIFRIDFEDLNGDNRNEVIVSTCRNWNGNTWQEVYYHSDKNKTIKYAGSFSTDYVIKKEKKQLEETFEASWYIDKSKTLYEWRNEKLVPIKQIILAHQQPVSENGKLTFEYYENSTDDLEGLKLKFKEPYNYDNKKQQQLWDNFFSKQ
ncbi:MAG: hypothetical protein JHD28_04750 [Bacteroidia bacterium]|nr:hypothetical protein [Bacteroidia bacterium]